MKCPECGLQLGGSEQVCPRCLTPLPQQVDKPAASWSAADLSAIQQEAQQDTRPRTPEMTADMRHLMQGPLWTTRRTQLALTLFLLVVAVAVLVVTFMSVSRRNAGYYVEQAHEQYKAGQYGLAVTSYLRALEIDPDVAEAENGLGWSYLRIGQPSLAVPHLNNAVSMDAELLAAHRGLGVAYSVAHMNVEAEASLKSALKINASDLEALRYLGQVYYQEQRYDEAIETLEKVTGARGDDIAALEYLGRSLHAMERYDEALVPLQEAYDLDPSVEPVRETLGLVWTELGRYDKAREHFSYLLTAHPDEPAWYAYVGHTLYREGDLEAATSYLTHALTLARADPVLSGSHRTLGWVRYQEARYDEAIVMFQRASIMDPLDPDAMAGLGWCYVQLGRCDEAAPLFESALALDPYLEQAKRGMEACP